jgi:ADP-heptose:LPS heptosyltransferase
MNILIIRPLPLGNATYALPFIDAVSQIPGPKNIFILACPLSAVLFEKHPAVTKVLHLPAGKLGFKQTLTYAKLLRSLNIDVAFLMKTGGTMERLALLAGIPHRVGFQKTFFQALTHRFKVDDNAHISEQTIQLLRYFPHSFSKLTAKDWRPTLKLSQEEIDETLNLLEGQSMAPQKYFTVHPMGSTIASSGLNHPLFIKLVPYIAKQINCTPVFIGAPSEKTALDELAKQTLGITYIQKSTPREIIQLMSQARLHLGNDSGWSHVAEALKIPKIVLYPDNHLNFKRWAPLALERSLPLLNPSHAPLHEVEKGVSVFLNSISLSV